jgi:hypothetical protein
VSAHCLSLTHTLSLSLSLTPPSLARSLALLPLASGPTAHPLSMHAPHPFLSPVVHPMLATHTFLRRAHLMHMNTPRWIEVEMRIRVCQLVRTRCVVVCSFSPGSSGGRRARSVHRPRSLCCHGVRTYAGLATSWMSGVGRGCRGKSCLRTATFGSGVISRRRC